MDERKSSFFKALFVSIIGAACWEYIRPHIGNLFEKLLTILGIDSFSFALIDKIYKDMASNPYSDSSFMLLMLALWCMAWFFFFNMRLYSPKKGASSNAWSDYSHYIINLCFFVAMIISIARASFIFATQTHTLNNIEIVAPYITSQEYKKLKSNYYSIQTKDDYDELSQTIKSIAQDNKLTLQE